MKSFFLVFVLLIIVSPLFSQINKGQWLTGGITEIKYSYSYYSVTQTSSYTDLLMKLSPNIGYFVADGFAFGLRPTFVKEISTYSNVKSEVNQYIAAFFLRYYLLSSIQRWNIFVDGGYALGYEEVKNYWQNNYTSLNTYKIFDIFISGGPVIFLSDKIALEFTLSYNNGGIIGSNISENTILFGVGFQIHLGKGNNNFGLKKKIQRTIDG